MDDSFSVIEIIEGDGSEESIESTEPVEIFECNSLPDNMEVTEVVEKVEIEFKSLRVLEEREDIENTEKNIHLTSFCLRQLEQVITKHYQV